MLLRVFSEEKSDIKEKMFEYIFEESTNNRINERKNKSMPDIVKNELERNVKELEQCVE